MNGVLNLSVLDGWWYEGYVEGAGWALTEKRTYENQAFQDELDASTLYSMLESEILPLYYDVNEQGYSPRWIQYVKKSIAEIAPHYTTKRMMDDYFDRFYNKLAERSQILTADNYAKVREIVEWKEDTAAKWDNIEVLKLEFDPVQEVDIKNNSDRVYGEIILDKKDLQADLGVECVVVDFDSVTHQVAFSEKYEFELVKTEGSKLYFQTKEALDTPGTHHYAMRVYPKNPDLPHRADFAYVKWIS